MNISRSPLFTLIVCILVSIASPHVSAGTTPDGIAGAIHAKGRMASDEFILPGGTADLAAACDRNGLIAQSSDGSGNLLACVGRMWQPITRSAASPPWQGDSASDVHLRQVDLGYGTVVQLVDWQNAKGEHCEQYINDVKVVTSGPGGLTASSVGMAIACHPKVN